MSNENVPVFISYHGPDFDVAKEIAGSLEILTNKSKKALMSLLTKFLLIQVMIFDPLLKTLLPARIGF
jgi:hypothetical protein